MFSRLVTNPEMGLYVFEWDGTTDNGYGTAPVLTSNLTSFGVTDRVHAEHIVVDDIDGDGVQEVIVANNGLSAEDLFLIMSVTGDMAIGGFASLGVEATYGRSDYGSGSPQTMAVCDTDNDGKKELFCVAWNNLNVFIVEAQAADTYTLSNNVQLSLSDHSVIKQPVAYDFDGDGDDEVVFANYGGYVLYLYNSAGDAGTLALADFHALAEGSVPRIGLAVGDLDQDGKIDIYGTGYPGVDVVSFELTGSDMTDSTHYTVNTIYDDNNQGNGGAQPLFIPSADMDGDGMVELVVGYTSLVDSVQRIVGGDTVMTANPHPPTWVRVLEFDGTVTSVGEVQEWEVITPEKFELKQNYPNPFNPVTTIEFSVPMNNAVSLKIYNSLGQLVKTLVEQQNYRKGEHQVIWDSTNDYGVRVSSGVYLYVLRYDNYIISKRMTVIK
jgi:hypothetical protein